jgi:hypothetical protein
MMLDQAVPDQVWQYGSWVRLGVKAGAVPVPYHVLWCKMNGEKEWAPLNRCETRADPIDF